MKKLPLLLMMCWCSLSVFSHPPSKPSDVIDIKHYSFKLELNDSTDVIEGSAEITIVGKKKITDFELDLVSKNGQGKGMVIRTVTLNGSALRFSHQRDRVKVFLATPVSEATQLKITVTYFGIPTDGLIISKNKFGDRTFFADNWPNRGRNWIPVIDHPADKASVEFVVIAPLHYEVVANGIKKEESYLNKNQKLTRYREDAEISTKVMVIGVARFAIQQSGIVNHIPVESWVYPQNREAGFRDYAIAVKVLEFFNSHIGPYPYGKLANVQSKTTFGGLENASAIFYSENSITGKNDKINLIAHEIAHQWFGDSASEKEWVDVWLSEGFATYFANVYHEFVNGDARRAAEMAEDRVQVIEFSKKDQRPVVLNEVPENIMAVLSVCTYQKGSWVLHMLRKEIGNEIFWHGIRKYYETYKNSNASTTDFRNVMEQVSGKDLNTFFKQWLYTPGHPVLDGNWSYDEKAKNIVINIRQQQKSQIFKFSMEIAVFETGKSRPELRTVSINNESEQLLVPYPTKPAKIELDPGINLLFEGKLGN